MIWTVSTKTSCPFSWSEDRETLKLIFLVGDCPPHMDYDDGYLYWDICMEAVTRDIIINTVQCGDYHETVAYWQEIARLGEGKYAAVAQEGGMSVVDTPFDAELARLNALLEETVIPYGSVSRRTEYEDRREKVKSMAPSLAAERAAYKSTDTGMGSYDLIDALKEGLVELEKLKDRDLPEGFRGLSLEEKRAYLADVEQKREDLMKRIAALSAERGSYIDAYLRESPGDDSFDEVVQRVIEEQAAGKGITYRR